MDATRKAYTKHVESKGIPTPTARRVLSSQEIAARIGELRGAWQEIADYEANGIYDTYLNMACVLYDLAEALGLTGVDREQALGPEITQYVEGTK